MSPMSPISYGLLRLSADWLSADAATPIPTTVDSTTAATTAATMYGLRMELLSRDPYAESTGHEWRLCGGYMTAAGTAGDLARRYTPLRRVGTQLGVDGPVRAWYEGPCPRSPPPTASGSTTSRAVTRPPGRWC